MTAAAVDPAVLGATVLAATGWAAAGVVDHPWGTRCTVDWCQPQPARADRRVDVLTQYATLERLAAGHHCTPPARFHGIPAEAAGILDGHPTLIGFDEAWDAARAGRFTTYELCAGRS